MVSSVEVFDVTGQTIIKQDNVIDVSSLDGYFCFKTKEKICYINNNSIQRIEISHES